MIIFHHNKPKKKQFHLEFNNHVLLLYLLGTEWRDKSICNSVAILLNFNATNTKMMLQGAKSIFF